MGPPSNSPEAPKSPIAEAMLLSCLFTHYPLPFTHYPALLYRYVTSVNIACGGHVGTCESIAKTVALAAARGAGIGAHVSFPDHEGTWFILYMVNMFIYKYNDLRRLTGLHVSSPTMQDSAAPPSTPPRASSATRCCGRRTRSTGSVAARAHVCGTSCSACTRGLLKWLEGLEGCDPCL